MSADHSLAAQIVAPRKIRLDRREPRDPSRDEVRVKLQGCGVCASNLPVWEGRPWFAYPFRAGSPGHEGWGLVEAIGADVSGVAVGDRVAFLSDSAYAQHDFTTPNSLVKLPGELQGRDFPGEALGCAANIFRRAGIESGQTVAIVGVGFLGAAVAALAVRAGARVVALSRRPFALELGQRMGVPHTFFLHERDQALAQVRSDGLQGGFHRVVECAGTQETLDLASDLCGIRGRLVIAGYHQDGDRRVNMQQWNWRGLDVVNAHERDPQEYVRGMRDAVDMVVRGDLDLSALLTHRLPLQELSEAFRPLADRPDGFVKAVVSCE